MGCRTYHEGDSWKNRVQGNTKAFNTAGTKSEAEAEGRRMAKQRKVEHIVKKMDGTIGERNSPIGGSGQVRHMSQSDSTPSPGNRNRFYLLALAANLGTYSRGSQITVRQALVIA
nr:DUF2188 domain-containing protein [Arthrobacter sp. H14]